MESELVPSAATLELNAESIIKKVPGKILPIRNEESAFCVELSKKTMFDLRELLDRQNKILTNKHIVSKLPDQGKRAKELKVRIEQELKSRDEVGKAAALLAEMNLGHLNALEWTGHCCPGQMKSMASNVHYSNHEETDPLKILASHNGITAQKKQISILAPVRSLIKPEDLLDSCDSNANSNTNDTSNNSIKESLEGSVSLEFSVRNGSQTTKDEKDISCGNESSPPGLQPFCRSKPFAIDEPEPFAHFICHRYGHKESKDRFMLNKPLKPFSGSFPIKPSGRISSKPKIWVETNVTPPLLLHGNAKLLSLEESLDIQRKQNQQLKEIQVKHAAERLSTLHGIQMSGDIPSSVIGSMAYRHVCSDSDSDEEVNETELEDQELHDEDQQDRGTSVVYNVESS